MLYRLAVAGSSTGPVSAVATVAEALPTEKVNAPPTGWLSADTTRQATTYVPWASFPGSVTRAVSELPGACCASPVRTRWLSGSRTRKESSSRPTDSVKVRVMWRGADLRTVPSRGSVDLRAAWADAGSAPPRRSRTSTAPSSTGP